MADRFRQSRARTAVCWGLGLFAAIQLALNVLIESGHPEQCDPEFHVRLTSLRARLAEDPGRPLLLLMGSSRTVGSFVPEALGPLTAADGRPVLSFNFSHIAAGPLMHLIDLRRLLDHGIRPDWLAVEILPTQLADPRQGVVSECARFGDLPVLLRYRGARGAANFVMTRLAPCFRYRPFFQSRCLPGWLPQGVKPPAEQIPLDRLGGDRAWSQIVRLEPPEVQRRTAMTRAGYGPTLQNFHIEPMSDRAMHELLMLCRQERIRVVLFLSPEAREFRSWYPPWATTAVENYCQALAAEFHVPVADARCWLPDEEFSDGHHVLLCGALRFTRRLGVEVLAPLVAGRAISATAALPARQPLRADLAQAEAATPKAAP